MARLDKFTGAGDKGRINHLEHIVSEQNKLLKLLALQFAWYWYNENVKVLAIVSKLNGDLAELVSFSGLWSGGTYILDEIPMLLPGDEKKAGKWEPMLNLSEALQEAFAEGEEAEAEKADVGSS